MRQTHTRTMFAAGYIPSHRSQREFHAAYDAHVDYLRSVGIEPGWGPASDEPYECDNCPNEIYEGRLCECCQSDAR